MGVGQRDRQGGGAIASRSGGSAQVGFVRCEGLLDLALLQILLVAVVVLCVPQRGLLVRFARGQPAGDHPQRQVATRARTSNIPSAGGSASARAAIERAPDGSAASDGSVDVGGGREGDAKAARHAIADPRMAVGPPAHSRELVLFGGRAPLSTPRVRLCARPLRLTGAVEQPGVTARAELHAWPHRTHVEYAAGQRDGMWAVSRLQTHRPKLAMPLVALAAVALAAAVAAVAAVAAIAAVATVAAVAVATWGRWLAQEQRAVQIEQHHRGQRPPARVAQIRVEGHLLDAVRDDGGAAHVCSQPLVKGGAISGLEQARAQARPNPHRQATVRVCVHRQAPSLAGLAGLAIVAVITAAAARSPLPSRRLRRLRRLCRAPRA